MTRDQAYQGKTALVLAGGGLTGAVYHIGALRAIDDLLVDRSVNDFDIYVGTSAGAFIASLLANGLSPDVMLKVMDGSHKGIEPIERQHIYSMDYMDLMKWVSNLPKTAFSLLAEYLRKPGDMSLFDILWTFSGSLPSGIYDTLGLEKYIRRLLETEGCPNHFSELERELYIIATELDSGERVVFGEGYDIETPVSKAVAASSALPLFYKPLRIGDREYVDGALRGNASLDLAIERGANLVVCINPLVPFDSRGMEPFTKSKREYLSEKGISSVIDQALRILTHSGLEYHIKQLRRRHPEVDIILIEPRSDDYDMFFYNIMHYASRLVVAQHGFETVSLDLAEDYGRYKRILARHGIPISRRVLVSELAEIQASGYDQAIIRQVLEARSEGCRGKQRNTPACQLNNALAKLELVLEEMGE
jgi:predicted acylesterase/phospholipase RssA